MVASLNIPISIKWNTFVNALFQEHLSGSWTVYLRDVKHCQYFHPWCHNANTEQGIPVSMQTNVRVWSIKVPHRRFIPLFGNSSRWESQALRHSLHSLDKQMISMTTMDNLGKSDGPVPFICLWLSLWWLGCLQHLGSKLFGGVPATSSHWVTNVYSLEKIDMQENKKYWWQS